MAAVDRSTRVSGGELHLMPWIAIALTIGCLLAVSGLVAAESRNLNAARGLSKFAASTAFVLVALSLHAAASTYGQLVLLALVLSWIGDAFLLSRRSVLFLAGLGSFLLAHVAFSVAFATGALSTSAFLVGLILVSAIGVITLRWLWGRLDAPYKVAVAAYVVAIIAMCTMAIAHSAASQSWLQRLVRWHLRRQTFQLRVIALWCQPSSIRPGVYLFTIPLSCFSPGPSPSVCPLAAQECS